MTQSGHWRGLSRCRFGPLGWPVLASGEAMRRREFITILGGAAAWPLTAHGELLKLGFEVAQSSVAKYMVKRHGPPSQGWCTFLRNHAPDIAAMDLCVVPAIGFNLLYAFVIVRLGRRDLVWINVTANPTAEWIARRATLSAIARHGYSGQAHTAGLTLRECLDHLVILGEGHLRRLLRTY